ncbi:MAG: DUF4010 domain-containing protein [Alphaproteobacteria bacterium]
MELQRAGLAVAIGLLIGIERGWQERQSRDGARVAGIRTFTLIGTLGGLCGILAAASPFAIGLCFLGFALPFGALEWRHSRQSGNFSATNFIAGLLTFALGAYATAGDMTVAAAVAVATAVVLAERRLLHGFLKNLRWVELRGALALLVMTVVLLPVLPDRTVDPWQALNPYQIWLMTVLVGITCYGGYAAVRMGGQHKGLLFGGIAGGIATSTTVTWTFARLARQNPSLRADVLAAILAAWVVSLLRMTALAVVISPALLAPLTRPIAASAGILAIGGFAAWQMARRTQPQTLKLRDPFEFWLMLRFCALLCGIMLLSRFVSAQQGGQQGGLFALGGLSGLLDVDPITLSMARLAQDNGKLEIAAQTIMVAAAANGLAKAFLGSVFGGWRLGTLLCLAAAGALAAGLGALQLA